jgi:hypothetical protein
MHTTGGMQQDFKRYVAGKKLLNIVQQLALNKESKLSYRHGTTSLSLSY